MIKISFFVRDPFKGRDRQGRPRWAFNPYVVIGSYELCVGRNGFAIHTPSRSMGWIRGSGWWRKS